MIFFNFPKVFIFYIHFLIKINSILLGKIVDLIKEKKKMVEPSFNFHFLRYIKKMNLPKKEKKNQQFYPKKKII